jgi:hypothetical protein
VAAAVGCLILVVLVRASFGVDVAAIATSAALSSVLMRRFFGLIGGGDVNGRAARG